MMFWGGSEQRFYAHTKLDIAESHELDYGPEPGINTVALGL